MVKIIPIEQEFAKLDLKDKKILYELDVNARQSSSEIGKKVGLSKQVVAYRINKMLENKAIKKFYTVLDTSKLGYATYKIFIRLQNVDVEKQNEIVDYIKNHEHVQFFMTSDGMFDLVFNILAKDITELYNILKELENAFGDYIAEKDMMMMVFSSFFFRDYLINRQSDELRGEMHFGSSEVSDIDENDKKILHCLGIDARMPLIEIANNMGISADSVSIKIKRMEKLEIINNYILLPNFALLGQTSYKVLFALRNLTEEKEKAFLEYCRIQPNIWFHSKSLGNWDLEINLDVDNASEFRKIMMEIKSQFSHIIKGYNTLQVSEIHKFNFYPF